MKKLYRNDYDKIIAGICSGVGEYYHKDVTIIRIISVFLLLLLPWIVIPTYLVAWFITPIKRY